MQRQGLRRQNGAAPGRAFRIDPSPWFGEPSAPIAARTHDAAGAIRMSELTPANRLDRPGGEKFDHVLGPADAPITLVEYGSYACPYCRAANERIAEVRDQFGDRMRYVFRHRPLTGVELAPPAAALGRRAPDPDR